MTNNDILKRLRYALSISDKLAVKIFRLGKTQMTEEEFCSLLLRPDEDDFQKCNNSLLFSFLDGLIVLKRGNLEKPVEEIKITKNNLNNLILRKLKIALQLRSEDMLSLFKLGELNFRIQNYPLFSERKDIKTIENVEINIFVYF